MGSFAGEWIGRARYIKMGIYLNPGNKGFCESINSKIYVDKTVEGAIAQIKDRHYVDALKDYQGNLLLAGIDYNKKTKKHTCVIEKMEI